VLVSARATKRVERGRVFLVWTQRRDARGAQRAAHGRDARAFRGVGVGVVHRRRRSRLRRRARRRARLSPLLRRRRQFVRAMPGIVGYRVRARPASPESPESARARPDRPARAAREPHGGARARPRLRLGRDRRGRALTVPARAFRLRDRRHDDGLEVRGDALEPARVVLALARACPRAGTRRPEGSSEPAGPSRRKQSCASAPRAETRTRTRNARKEARARIATTHDAWSCSARCVGGSRVSTRRRRAAWVRVDERRTRRLLRRKKSRLGATNA